jgi:hypothetical protein
MTKNTSGPLWNCIQTVWRLITVVSYPLSIVFIALVHWKPTLANAIKLNFLTLSVWIGLDACFYTWVFTYPGPQAWSQTTRVVAHVMWGLGVDMPLFVILIGGVILVILFGSKTSANRLFGWSTRETPGDTPVKPCFKGKKIVIMGNGPSVIKGDPLGYLIDDMDEVIRFNNFQTAASGFGDWTGSKTTVHFSDTMLYPSYPEYAVNNATVVLSLFMDRLIVSGSYCIFRSAIDLEFLKTYRLLSNPALGWVPHEDITNLKKTLGLSTGKHPTSGCLAIDWFVRNRPDEDTPIYIHGFDFFEGDTIHYYDKTEPLYERLNDLLGVTMMHQPGKEKGFVHNLVKEGKVKWLKDLAKEVPNPNKK